MNEKPLSRRKVVASIGAISVTGLIGACSTAEEEIAVEQPAIETSPEASAPAEGETASSNGLISVSEIPVGGAVILSEEKVVITQPTPGEINAFSTTCTHQGCPVSQVGESGIICACHNSVFSTLDGSVVSGPASRPLDPIKVSIQGDQVIRG